MMKALALAETGCDKGRNDEFKNEQTIFKTGYKVNCDFQSAGFGWMEREMGWNSLLNLSVLRKATGRIKAKKKIIQGLFINPTQYRNWFAFIFHQLENSKPIRIC